MNAAFVSLIGVNASAGDRVHFGNAATDVVGVVDRVECVDGRAAVNAPVENVPEVGVGDPVLVNGAPVGVVRDVAVRRGVVVVVVEPGVVGVVGGPRGQQDDVASCSTEVATEGSQVVSG